MTAPHRLTAEEIAEIEAHSSGFGVIEMLLSHIRAQDTEIAALREAEHAAAAAMRERCAKVCADEVVAIHARHARTYDIAYLFKGDTAVFLANIIRALPVTEGQG